VPELIVGGICRTAEVKLQDLIIASKLQQWPQLVDVYAVFCGNPTHNSVTAYALFISIFRVSGLVQVDAEVFRRKNMCQLYRQELCRKRVGSEKPQ
jgi:hypothetical protein